MTSVILRAACQFLAPLLALLSVFMLLRGHNEPGGGFIGGLLMATSIALYILASGAAEARRRLRVHPRSLVGAGLALAALSGVPALLAGQAPMTGWWLPVEIPGLGKLSTVLLFDTGVYLVVWGAMLLGLMTLSEE
ncbi:MAG: Na+/H+ antiporter subunit B [Phycisphaerales bacterium]|nr:Na+/H+ antiporter subunit B [Phycisphaerales bacterium]